MPASPPTASLPLGPSEADAAALFHQIVFECKVHSALYGCTFASLSYVFRTWRWLAGSEADEWRREIGSLRQKLQSLEHSALAKGDARAITDSAEALADPLTEERMMSAHQD